MIGHQTINRWTLRASGVTVLAAIVGLGLYELFGAELVRKIYAGEWLPSVGRLVAAHLANNPEHDSAEFLVTLGRTALWRATALSLVLHLGLWAMLHLRPTVLVDYFRATDSALNLSVLRIALFAAMLIWLDVGEIVEAAGRPERLRYYWPLTGWIFQLLPINTHAAWLAGYAFWIACLAGLVGLASRWSVPAATVLAIYVLGIPNLYGKVNHGYHFLVWCAILLSVSRSADALSIDAWWHRYRTGKNLDAGPSVIYALPLRFVWLLMGVMYFFAGIWKVLIGGAEWALSDSLRYKMYSAWYDHHFIPGFRIDHYPLLYRSSAVLTVLFEIAFIYLIFFPRCRPVLALGGLAFHNSLKYFMRIGAETIQLCYVALIDWSSCRNWLTRRRGGCAERPQVNPSTRPAIALIASTGTALVLINSLCGIGLINSWPFSVYPTHAGISGPWITSLEAKVRDANGDLTPIDVFEGYSTTNRRGAIWQIVGSRDQQDAEQKLTQLAQRWAERHQSAGDYRAVEFYRVQVDKTPEHWDRPPEHPELFFTVPLTASSP